MKFNIPNKQASGVYAIRNTKNNKVYVGSAVNLYNRYRVHCSMLIAGKHDNKHLQHSYNKHGLDAFEFNIMEYCDSEDLIQREALHIQRHFGKDCYNINPMPTITGMNGRYHREISLVSPEGELYNFSGNIREIARIMVKCHGLSRGENYVYHGLVRILSRKSIHFIGWRLPENRDADWKKKTVKKYHSKHWAVKLVSPEGTVYGPIKNLKSFCRELNITNYDNMINLIAGRIKSINGWRLLGAPTDARNSKTYNVIIQDPDGNHHGPITNLTKFAREHNIPQSSLRQFVIGKLKTCKNWKIIKSIEGVCL